MKKVSSKPETFVKVKVGVARFELATSWSQTRRDDRTTLHPELRISPLTFKEQQLSLFTFSEMGL